MDNLNEKVMDKLLERFDKYPDPMEVQHIADLLNVKRHVVYYIVNTYPKDIPHMRIGGKIIFPKVRVIPWWIGQAHLEKVM